MDEGTPIEEIAGYLGFILSLADIILYVKEYEEPRSADDKPFTNFLHCAMSCLHGTFHVPAIFYQLAISSCKEERFYGWDEHNRTPLSIALSARSYDCHFVIGDSISKLIKSSPGKSRMAIEDGVIPLHLAIRNGLKWDDGIKEILSDAPEALSTKDINSRLYPFMHAAAGYGTDLNTVYKLLQEDPLLASGLAGCPSWQKMQQLKAENETLLKQNQKLELLVNDYVETHQRQKKEIAGMQRIINDLKSQIERREAS